MAPGLEQRALLASAALFACASACTGARTEAAPSDGGSLSTNTLALPCDVDLVLARGCRTCHGDPVAFGAPMPLVTHDHLVAPSTSDPSKKMYEVARERVHLPAGAVGRMPQKPNAPLEATELATLDRWIDAGAKPRIGSCTGGPTEVPNKPLSCTPDVMVRPKTKWSMPRDERDVYACYGFDLDATEKRHIIGIVPRIVNPKIVHHVILSQAEEAYSATPRRCSEGSVARNRMLYAWAPGVGNFEMPKEAGLPVEPGITNHYVMQVHYNNVQSLEGELDDSGFDFCSTTELRPNDADVLAFGTMQFSIPPRAKLDLTATYTLMPSFGTIHVIGAFPHMHQLGTSITTVLRPGAGGGPFDLGSAPSFDFQSQFFAPLPDVIVRPGDEIDTRCVWQNSTHRTVGMGERTEDEMCFSFTMYYPRVVSPQWTWILPSALSAVTVHEE